MSDHPSGARARHLRRALILAACLVFALVSPRAAEAERRFRVSLSVGGYNSLDEVRSDAANELRFVDPAGNELGRLLDPRNDLAITGSLELRSGTLFNLGLQFVATPNVLLEASVGYTECDVGNAEAQFQTIGSFFSTWSYERIPLGELSRIPVQLSALYRFRPEATLRPYLGGGVGYAFHGFEPSPELDQLSLELSRSRGLPTSVFFGATGQVLIQQPPPLLAGSSHLAGAEVDAPDSFEWHVAAGLEFALARRWALFADLRYTRSSREYRIRFDDGDQLGRSVPDEVMTVGGLPHPDFPLPYGPMYIAAGGFYDVDGDGQPDPGYYYIQGGNLDFDGLSLLLGIRLDF